MKYFKFLPFLIILFTACRGESQQASSPVGGVVDVNAFESLLKSEHQLVDVRTPEEYAEGYIDGATNINIYDEGFEEKISVLAKDKPILVYCKKGGRSAKAYNILKSKGYNEIYDLQGGMTAWNKAAKPVVK